MADKKVNLRTPPGRPAVVSGPKPAEVNLPGLKGTLPFTEGKAVGRHAQLPKEVQDEERRISEAPLVTPDKELKKVITPPAPVSLDELSEEAQKEVLDTVRAAVTAAPKPAQQFVPRGPGISEAKRLADKAAAQIEKKLQAKPVSAPPQPPQAAPVEPVKDPPGPADAGGQDAQPVKCVHCGWLVGSKDDTNPTIVDKQTFVASVLGQKRFVKDYPLFGNQLTVAFRSLTVDENDLVIKQLVLDWNNNQISGPAQSMAQATKYQLALGLESITTAVGRIVLPTLDEYDADPVDGATILPQVVDYVNAHAIKNEPTRHIITKAYGHFIDTQANLEAMAETPDFWQATAEQV